MEVHPLAGGSYGPLALVERGGVLDSPHLPGLTVAVDDVLADPAAP